MFSMKRRPNLTPQVDYTLLVVTMLGFKFLDYRLMIALILAFLVQHIAVTILESRDNR